MIRGHLDSLTPGGFAEGWAFDDAEPDRILTVRLADAEGAELGLGFANLYRGDLAEVGFRHGWCAFRLRLSRPTAELAGQRLVLTEAAGGTDIAATDAWRLREAQDGPATSLEAVLAADPTLLRAVQHLAGCGGMFAGFIERHGINDFVRTAYSYVLGRTADAAGEARYERLIALGAVTPFGLLALLADSEEFRREPRLLSSPADPGFIFTR
jgi:hypothetical protein